MVEVVFASGSAVAVTGSESIAVDAPDAALVGVGRVRASGDADAGGAGEAAGLDADALAGDACGAVAGVVDGCVGEGEVGGGARAVGGGAGAAVGGGEVGGGGSGQLRPGPRPEPSSGPG